MRTFGPVLLAFLAPMGVWLASPLAQQPVAQVPPITVVQPIDPGSAVLPAEDLTVGVTRFSFIAYGDTRGQADGRELQRDHGRIVDAMIEAIRSRASSPFPVRFIVQSGDAVTSGAAAEQWNVSFTPIIERLTREGHVPFFVAVGNHDTTARPLDDPLRQRCPSHDARRDVEIDPGRRLAEALGRVSDVCVRIRQRSCRGDRFERGGRPRAALLGRRPARVDRPRALSPRDCRLPSSTVLVWSARRSDRGAADRGPPPVVHAVVPAPPRADDHHGPRSFLRTLDRAVCG